MSVAVEEPSSSVTRCISLVRQGQPIANVKDDLLRFGLKVKHVVRLAWWGTDLTKPKPSLSVIITLVNLFRMLVGLFRGVRIPLKIVQENSDLQELIMVTLRKYFGQARFGIGSSLVKPEEGDAKLTGLFTLTQLKPEL